MIRVLHLKDTLDAGGVAGVIRTLAAHGDGARVRHYLCALGAPTSAPHMDLGPIIFVPTAPRGPGPAFLDQPCLTGLMESIRRNGIHVVHCHSRKAYGYGALSAFLTRRKYVVTLHGNPFWQGRNGYVARPLGGSTRFGIAARLYARLTDRFVCVSPHIASLASTSHFARPSQCLTILNGVDTARFAPWSEAERDSARAAWGLTKDDALLVAMGMLVPGKGHDALIRAMARLTQTHPRARLWIAGHGPERAALETLIAELKLASSVTLLGFRPDAAALYNAADAVVSGAQVEGLSLALLEAMSCARPVIVRDIPANRDIVLHETSGLLVPSDEADDLAHAFARVLDDAPLRERLGGRARAWVMQNAACEHMTKSYEHLYEQLAASVRPHSIPALAETRA